MEGLDAPAATPVFIPRKKEKSAPLWHGYVAASLVAAVCYAAHLFYKPVSAAILAILFGAVLRNLSLIPAGVVDGCKGLVRRVIPITIVLTGATLNLADVGKGAQHAAVVLVAIAMGTAAAIFIGRMLGASRKTAMLIGAGTSICGNSAIISVAPVVSATDEDLLLSVGTINVLGLVIMLLLPVAGAGLHMSAESFGVWAGSTVHAVPQAVTTGFAFGPEAGALAALVKLVRVSLLAPYVLLMALLARRESPGSAGPIRYASLIPPFLWGFVAFALISTLGLLPELTFKPLGAGGPITVGSSKLLGDAGSILLTLSMAAMGLEVNLKQLLRTGGPAMLTGIFASVLQCLATWLTIHFLL